MARLSWSELSNRVFETGLDRGVLYLTTSSDEKTIYNLATQPIPTEDDIAGEGAGYKPGPNPWSSGREFNPSDSGGPNVGGRILPWVKLSVGSFGVPTFNFISWQFTDMNPSAEDGSDALVVSGSHQYRVSFYYALSATYSVSGNGLGVEYSWYDAAGVKISTGVTNFEQTIKGEWVRVSFLLPVAPSTAKYVALATKFLNGQGSWYNDGLSVSGLIITDVTDRPGDDVVYFDGNTHESETTSYHWAGGINDSISYSEIVYKSAAWDGLMSVDEAGGENAAAYYIDGRPYLFLPKPKEYSATITAYTYPDEFMRIMGQIEATDGMYLDSQMGESFGLSYRTLVGNAIDGVDHGYKIHLIYNATVVPQSVSYETTTNSINPIGFTWEIQAVPVLVDGYRPTAHVTIDTRHMDSDKLAEIEALLYGTETSAPRLPDPQEIFDILSYGDMIIINDLGNGKWEAIGSYKNVYLIGSPGDGVFEIDNVDAVDHGDGTYDISSTNV